MKYIELYLNQREEELKKEKEKEVERFRKDYQNAINNEDIESLICNSKYDYGYAIELIDMQLNEIEKLRNDLIPKNENNDLESQV